MTVQPIDLSAFAGTIMAGLFVLIPTIGLTVRFALKPVIEAITSLRDTNRERIELEQLARRIEVLERQLEEGRLPAQIPARASAVGELPGSRTSTERVAPLQR